VNPTMGCSISSSSHSAVRTVSPLAAGSNAPRFASCRGLSNPPRSLHAAGSNPPRFSQGSRRPYARPPGA
jgi:hypothetical protein